MNIVPARRAALISIVFVLMIFNLEAQQDYRYTVDLNKVENDQLAIELICPKISTMQTRFYLPKIVPGTYMNSNFGKYLHELKAYDKAGKQLPVTKISDNGWEIGNAKNAYRLTYKVEDTWDSEIKNQVYPMCGTSFEAGKNFVINTPGLFGYFEGMKKNRFELNFIKPQNFYAATGLKPFSTSTTRDVFHCSNADELYDSPIMFSLPDTTTIRVGNSDVLVAVYAPKKLVTSRFIAANLEKLLIGTKDYLGGKLPVDKYAFIFYFNSEQKKMAVTGAWEHSYSSFYSLDEAPQEESIEGWVDISSHEFFHIVTPLTISSREVREFNFNETRLSKHLWLYEGSTEYYAHHMQVWAGLKTPEQFLGTLAQKINYSRSFFNDSLSFTELSTESAGKWNAQYVNVYMKGALISACLDLYLLKLSGGQYAFRDLKHDLGIKYGKDKFFEDAELFDEIEKLTYPEIKQFLLTYVEGNKPIPYEEYFGMAGVQYLPKEKVNSFSLGGVSINPTDDGRLVLGIKQLNEFGKRLGYLEGDELESINGKPVTASNIQALLEDFNTTIKDGDTVKVMVKRKNSAGEQASTVLSAPAKRIERTMLHVLKFDKNPTAEQSKIRDAWLNSACKTRAN